MFLEAQELVVPNPPIEAPVAGPSVEELKAQLAEAMKKYQALLDKGEAAAKRRQEEG